MSMAASDGGSTISGSSSSAFSYGGMQSGGASTVVSTNLLNLSSVKARIEIGSSGPQQEASDLVLEFEGGVVERMRCTMVNSSASISEQAMHHVSHPHQQHRHASPANEYSAHAQPVPSMKSEGAQFATAPLRTPHPAMFASTYDLDNADTLRDSVVVLLPTSYTGIESCILALESIGVEAVVVVELPPQVGVPPLSEYLRSKLSGPGLQEGMPTALSSLTVSVCTISDVHRTAISMLVRRFEVYHGIMRNADYYSRPLAPREVKQWLMEGRMRIDQKMTDEGGGVGVSASGGGGSTGRVELEVLEWDKATVTRRHNDTFPQLRPRDKDMLGEAERLFQGKGLLSDHPAQADAALILANVFQSLEMWRHEVFTEHLPLMKRLLQPMLENMGDTHQQHANSTASIQRSRSKAPAWQVSTEQLIKHRSNARLFYVLTCCNRFDPQKRLFADPPFAEFTLPLELLCHQRHDLDVQYFLLKALLNFVADSSDNTHDTSHASQSSGQLNGRSSVYHQRATVDLFRLELVHDDAIAKLLQAMVVNQKLKSTVVGANEVCKLAWELLSRFWTGSPKTCVDIFLACINNRDPRVRRYLACQFVALTSEPGTRIVASIDNKSQSGALVGHSFHRVLESNEWEEHVSKCWADSMQIDVVGFVRPTAFGGHNVSATSQKQQTLAYTHYRTIADTLTIVWHEKGTERQEVLVRSSQLHHVDRYLHMIFRGDSGRAATVAAAAAVGAKQSEQKTGCRLVLRANDFKAYFQNGRMGKCGVTVDTRNFATAKHVPRAKEEGATGAASSGAGTAADGGEGKVGSSAAVTIPTIGSIAVTAFFEPRFTHMTADKLVEAGAVPLLCSFWRQQDQHTQTFTACAIMNVVLGCDKLRLSLPTLRALQPLSRAIVEILGPVDAHNGPEDTLWQETILAKSMDSSELQGGRTCPGYMRGRRLKCVRVLSRLEGSANAMARAGVLHHLAALMREPADRHPKSTQRSVVSAMCNFARLLAPDLKMELLDEGQHLIEGLLCWAQQKPDTVNEAFRKRDTGAVGGAGGFGVEPLVRPRLTETIYWLLKDAQAFKLLVNLQAAGVGYSSASNSGNFLEKELFMLERESKGLKDWASVETRTWVARCLCLMGIGGDEEPDMGGGDGSGTDSLPGVSAAKKQSIVYRQPNALVWSMDKLAKSCDTVQEDKLLFVRLWCKMAFVPSAHEALQQLQVELQSFSTFFDIHSSSMGGRGGNSRDEAASEKRKLRQRFLLGIQQALESPSRQLRKKVALECTAWVVADLKHQARANTTTLDEQSMAVVLTEELSSHGRLQRILRKHCMQIMDEFLDLLELVQCAPGSSPLYFLFARHALRLLTVIVADPNSPSGLSLPLCQDMIKKLKKMDSWRLLMPAKIEVHPHRPVPQQPLSPLASPLLSPSGMHNTTSHITMTRHADLSDSFVDALGGQRPLEQTFVQTFELVSVIYKEAEELDLAGIKNVKSWTVTADEQDGGKHTAALGREDGSSNSIGSSRGKGGRKRALRKAARRSVRMQKLFKYRDLRTAFMIDGWEQADVFGRLLFTLFIGPLFRQYERDFEREREVMRQSWQGQPGTTTQAPTTSAAAAAAATSAVAGMQYHRDSYFFSSVRFRRRPDDNEARVVAVEELAILAARGYAIGASELHSGLMDARRKDRNNKAKAKPAVSKWKQNTAQRRVGAGAGAGAEIALSFAAELGKDAKGRKHVQMLDLTPAAVLKRKQLASEVSATMNISMRDAEWHVDQRIQRLKLEGGTNSSSAAATSAITSDALMAEDSKLYGDIVAEIKGSPRNSLVPTGADPSDGQRRSSSTLSGLGSSAIQGLHPVKMRKVCTHTV
jgi:hypothetical protein